MALLQLLLELHRQSPSPTIQWYGQTHPIPLPGGVATSSGWFDLTHSLPSVYTNYKYDYLPHPSFATRRRYVPDSIWPANPPRNNIYANDDCLLHPLVSPITAPDWTNAPPLLFLTGEEQLADENRLVAIRARSTSSSSPVIYEEYAKLPHCFCLLLSPGAHPASRKCYESWAAFCRDCVDPSKRAGLKSKATIVHPKTLKERQVDWDELFPGDKSLEQIKQGMRRALDERFPRAGAEEKEKGESGGKKAQGTEVVV